MLFVIARGEVVRQRKLDRHTGGQGAHQLQFLNSQGVLTRGNPADAKTGDQGFGKRRAAQGY